MGIGSNSAKSKKITLKYETAFQKDYTFLVQNVVCDNF
jgi:hypothetical protein